MLCSHTFAHTIYSVCNALLSTLAPPIQSPRFCLRVIFLQKLSDFPFHDSGLITCYCLSPQPQTPEMAGKEKNWVFSKVIPKNIQRIEALRNFWEAENRQNEVRHYSPVHVQLPRMNYTYSWMYITILYTTTKVGAATKTLMPGVRGGQQGTDRSVKRALPWEQLGQSTHEHLLTPHSCR